jgi:hypothetical protein
MKSEKRSKIPNSKGIGGEIMDSSDEERAENVRYDVMKRMLENAIKNKEKGKLRKRSLTKKIS